MNSEEVISKIDKPLTVLADFWWRWGELNPRPKAF